MTVRERQNNRRRYRDLANMNVAGILAPPPPEENQVEVPVPQEPFLRVVDPEVVARDAVSVAHKQADAAIETYKQRFHDSESEKEKLREKHERAIALKDLAIAKLEVALEGKQAEYRALAITKATEIKFNGTTGFTARKQDDGSITVS